MSSSLDNLPKLPKPNFSREHRLGLVVYGGVSLAIYMYGICQEFYNAVRGRGIYKLIKALTDADIVVDIISGTSAGGINGVLLSYALANSQGKKWINFEEFAEVWKDSGDIDQLLFNKKYDGFDKSSFFDGKGYYKAEIYNALIARKDDLEENSSEDDWVSKVEELDLFITGTDILGRIYQVFDNTRCVIEVKDHHTVFHLKYREHGDNDFKSDETTCEALAKLCQITSCFPVAFPPVTVELEPEEHHADKKLVEWGGLKKNRILPERWKLKQDPSKASNEAEKDKKKKKREKIEDDPGEGYRLHFVDGGVLDNRPFTYTIKAIYHRAAERPVFRKLFYVDPSPDRFKDSDRYKKMLKPDVVQVVQDSLLGVPRYESINNDLELINEHNEKVLRYRFLLADLEALLDIQEKDIENKDFYDQQRNVYLRTRLISLEDKLLPLIFLESEDIENPISSEDRTQKLKKVAELLNKRLTDPTGSSQRLKLLTELAEPIRYLDVDYALRQYFFITEYVYRLLDQDYLKEWLKNKNKIENPSINGDLLESLKILISKLNHYRNIIEVIKDKIDKLFKSKEIEKYFFELVTKFPNEKFPEKFYRSMLWLHGQFLDIELPSNLSIQQLTEVLEKKLQDVKDSIPKLNYFSSSDKQLTILKELADTSILEKLLDKQKLKELLKEANKELYTNSFKKLSYYDDIQEKLLNYFDNFDKLDTVLYPLDYLAGIPEKQLIETFRISPEDAKLGFSSNSKFKDGNRLDKKLAGDSLNAFGGFLKKTWRANDILWGRLDGFNRIVDALVTKEKIKKFKKFLHDNAEREKIEPDQYLDRLLEEALSPNFDPKRKSNSEEDKQYLRTQRAELKEKIKKLIPKKENEQISEKDLTDFVKSLVSIGHLLILDQEFEETMQTSIEEQLGSKQQKKPDRVSDDKPGSIKQKCGDALQNCSGDQLDRKQQKQLPKESQAPLNIPFIQTYLLFKWSLESGLYSLTRYFYSQVAYFDFDLIPIPIPKFDPINLSFDSAITALVVKEVAKKSLASMSLEEKKNFFNKHYNIGLETWEHIPKSKLLGLLIRAISIFQDIFATWQHTNETRQENKISSRSTFWNILAFVIGSLIKVTLFGLKVSLFGIILVLKIMRPLVK
jgi:patatin-related protein